MRRSTQSAYRKLSHHGRRNDRQGHVGCHRNHPSRRWGLPILDGHGTQAEFVRIPHADNSLYPVPAGADEEALVMLSDILPTVSSAGC